MSRILVVTEELDQLSKQFSQFTKELQNIDQTLHRTLSGVNWESRYRRDVEQKWDTLRKQSNNIAQRTYRLSQYLSFVAQAFREADKAGKVLSKPEYQNLKTKAPSDLSFPKNPPQGFFEFIGGKIDDTLEAMHPKRVMDAIKEEFNELREDISHFVDEAGEFINDKYQDAVQLIDHIKTTWEDDELRKEIIGGLIDIGLGTLTAIEGGVMVAGSVGATILSGGTLTLGTIGTGALGSYIFVDGVSNVTGGASKIWNAFDGDPTTKGDTANFVKNFYIDTGQKLGLSERNSEIIYGTVSIGTALWNIPKGVKELVGDIDKMQDVRAVQDALPFLNLDNYIKSAEENFIMKILYDYALKSPFEFYRLGNEAEDLGETIRKPE